MAQIEENKNRELSYLKRLLRWNPRGCQYNFTVSQVESSNPPASNTQLLMKVQKRKKVGDAEQ